MKLKPDYGYTERTDLVAAVLYTLLPRFRNLQVSDPSKKPPCRAVFSYLKLG